MDGEICRVHARLAQGGGEGDRLALRLRLTHLLHSAELQPTAMPPSAILIVRRLDDPLPGQLVPWQGARHAVAVWERATRDVLADLYRRAARPSQGYVHTSAEAVLFADEGELLACLALDMSRSEASEHWWWRAILRTLPSSSSAGLATLLCSRAASVPAALHHLAEGGHAVTVMRALSPRQAMAVLSAMGQAYGIADFRLGPAHAAGLSGAQGYDLQPKRQGSKGGNLQSINPANAQSPSSPARPTAISSQPTETVRWVSGVAPWATTLVPPDLGKERACLLGVGLNLHTQPAVVRSNTFLHALRDWWTEPMPAASQKSSSLVMESLLPLPERKGPTALDKEVAVETTPAPTATPILVPQRAHVAVEEGGAGGFPLRQDVRPVPEVNPQEGVSLAVAQSTETGTESKEMPKPASADDRHSVRQTVIEIEQRKSHQPARRGQTNRQSQTIAPDPTQEPQAMPKQAMLLLMDGIDTGIGGVLYLINLMRHLDLPACFEADWGLDSQVGAWGVLEVLGRALLGQYAAHLAEDPLWAALATLGGREPGELPGAALRGSKYFRLPASWLAQVPAGFHQAPLADLGSPLLAGLNPHLVRWLTLTLPYLRFRLQQALQLTTTEAADLGKTLLLYPGRLYVTATHVDLVMRLQDISLPVRLAGLDCNPGWMPDFARVVLLHFV